MNTTKNMKKEKPQKKEKLSLYPLQFNEALATIFEVPPKPIQMKKKKEKVSR